MSLTPADGIFVGGKPVTDMWAAPGLRWRGTLAAHLAGPIKHPYLVFTRNDRAAYDLDNLVYPVVAVSGCAACESIWAVVQRGETEGVLIRDVAPPPPPTSDEYVTLYIARPSRSSVRDRAVVPELQDVLPFGDDEPIGLALEFDSPDVAVGEMSYEGPIKSCIDDLTPLFGERMISGRMLAKDDRVRELRITRGHKPERAGVTVTVWRLPQPEVCPPMRPPSRIPSAPTISEPIATEKTTMLVTFIDDDPGFNRWRETHPRGYIVNHEREPKPRYLKLHRATCWTIAGALPARGDNWTTALAKTCSDDLNELHGWAHARGGELDPCRTCGP